MIYTYLIKSESMLVFQLKSVLEERDGEGGFLLEAGAIPFNILDLVLVLVDEGVEVGNVSED